MSLIPIPESDVDNIDKLFSKNETDGLYFKFIWGNYRHITEPQISDYLWLDRLNSEGYKKAQLFFDGDIIDFDEFRAKSNLKYLLLIKSEDEIYFHYIEPHFTFKENEKLALELMKKGSVVLLSELHNKTKGIITKTGVEPIQPFSKQISEGNIFYYHTRTSVFSNVITEKEERELDYNIVGSWMPPGHSNLIVSRRLAYFCYNELTYFEKPKNDVSTIVFARDGNIASFENFIQAIEYCKTKNNRYKIGCEFLICEALNSLSYH